MVTFSIGRPLAWMARRKSRMRRWKSGSPPPASRIERVPASRSSPSSSAKRGIGISSVPRSAAVEQKKQSMLQRSAGWISTWYGPPWAVPSSIPSRIACLSSRVRYFQPSSLRRTPYEPVEGLKLRTLSLKVRRNGVSG